ncbi:MAG: glycoside hydrolase family 10 protein [bacterium]
MFFFVFLVAFSDFRGIWIPRWSIQDNQKIFDIIGNNFNHIFLQIFGNGEAYYSSDIVPCKVADDRWLKELLREAHYRGIKVSAWINVLYSWGYSPLLKNKKHPINFARDWYVVDNNQNSILNYDAEALKSMGIEGYYLAPANPSVRIYLLKIIEEIITKYEFDGIHLDYIRYPSENFIYDIYLRTHIQRKYFYDPIEFDDDFLAQRLGISGIDDIQHKAWDLVRQDLTDFVAQIKNKVKAIKPECLVSAAVKPDYVVARNDYYQDWLTWVNDGLVDFVCLMAYTNHIEPIIKKTLNRVNIPSSIIIGLDIYNSTPEIVKRQLEAIKKTSFAGFVYFSYPQVKEDRRYLELLEK